MQNCTLFPYLVCICPEFWQSFAQIIRQFSSSSTTNVAVDAAERARAMF
jgi:hypothetical protein